MLNHSHWKLLGRHQRHRSRYQRAHSDFAFQLRFKFDRAGTRVTSAERVPLSRTVVYQCIWLVKCVLARDVHEARAAGLRRQYGCTHRAESLALRVSTCDCRGLGTAVSVSPLHGPPRRPAPRATSRPRAVRPSIRSPTPCPARVSVCPHGVRVRPSAVRRPVPPVRARLVSP